MEKIENVFLTWIFNKSSGYQMFEEYIGVAYNLNISKFKLWYKQDQQIDNSIFILYIE